MYDFANSAFATTILAVIFNQYFATVVAGGEKGVELFGFRLHGASFFTFTISLSMAISAIFSPFLGAVADASGSKKRFLMVFCFTGVLFTGLLYFVHAGDYWMGAIFFIIANIGFAEGNVFYNAFLPEISTDQNIGRISGLGWALGYIGGGAASGDQLDHVEISRMAWISNGIFHGPRLFPLSGLLVADLFPAHISFFEREVTRPLFHLSREVISWKVIDVFNIPFVGSRPSRN